MQIIQNKSNDLTTMIFTVYLHQDDYNTELEKLIQAKQKNVKINGFRKGEVPINIIRHQYENTLKMQCIQKLLNKYIYDYIYREKIQILGDILLLKQDIHDTNNMLFQFEIGIMPQCNLVLNSLDLSYYKILFSNEEINKYIDKLKIYFNTIKSDKILNENDILIINIEIISKYKKKFNTNYNVIFKELPQSIRHLIIQKNKTGTYFYINSKDLFIELKDLNDTMKYKFQEHLPIKFLIKKIYHFDKKINIIDKIYGKNIIQSQEDFRSKIQLEIEKIYSLKSNELFFNSLLSILLKQTTINMPKNFLQRWIQKTYSISMEEVKEQYYKIEETISKKLIINQLYKIYNINHNQIQKEKNTNNLKLQDMIKIIIKNEDNIDIFSNSDFYTTKISLLKKQLNIKYQNCSLSEFKQLLLTN